MAKKKIIDEPISSTTQIETPTVGEREAVVSVIINNNKNTIEQKKVKLVVVNGQLVPDHSDTNPGVFSN